MKRTQYKQFAFGLLVYTLLVILWGAWVRISHSGDGCGDTWPLCHGQLIPEAERGKTWVEYGHRLMSGIYGLVVIYFWWVARKLYPKGHYARKAALATLIFTISEALLGAKLVLFGLVTTNDTPYRAFIMALHQINSFLLTGSVALTYAAALLTEDLRIPTTQDRRYRLMPWVIVIIGITGAWASLSNSLFPTDNLLQGLMDDFSSESHFLVRLRGFHPVLALLGGGGLALFFWLKAQTTESQLVQKRSVQMSLLLIAGILFGIATLLLHAPVWMKIVHLALAHTIWVVLLQWVFFIRSNKLT
ncbi:COX15/CtaA family protein [Bdellovibrio bacteriovorus]|uniref:Cytochrome aa3 controlling protein CtaA n=1 Tax=Bdellovibrio bacteriovorus (strain ATCC 15356 / DSM 50701 / NCIMB 9529 / HD100) TaxID=264462 RepID=Q6ML09_BDEBA|nr:COX15/CtaA family protein [Bdellovibrio bacteriovorus]AHZ84752.1 cytochrome aa3 controlling protein CtaA [Bdellovibrio bacteriovorus]BEV68639.1 Heme A synthase [Bdellovibrio bacteriovorus]CAE80048.1 cytochrome aa3 controlling protein CtaA [Bdellovibrio bacteriovorus HD100]